MGDQAERRNTRDHLLEAAVQVLLNADYDWAAGLTFERIADRAGVDVGTVRNHLGSKASVVRQVVDHMLVPRTLEYLDEIEMAVQAGDVPLAELVNQAAAAVHADNQSDDLSLTATNLLWVFRDWEPRLANRVAAVYDDYDRQIRLVMFTVFEELAAKGYRQRQGLSTSEFAVLANAIAEGVAIRSAIHPDLATDELLAKGFIALIAAWVAPDGDNRRYEQLLDHVDD